MPVGILNYRRRNFVVGTAETRKDPTSRVGHGNSNNVMDIEDFLLIRNYVTCYSPDSWKERTQIGHDLVAIMHQLHQILYSIFQSTLGRLYSHHF